MSFHGAVSRAISEPSLLSVTSGAVGSVPWATRPRQTLDRGALLRLFSTSPWVRVSVVVRAARRAEARWVLLAPAGRPARARLRRELALQHFGTAGVYSALDGQVNPDGGDLYRMLEAGDLVDVEEEYGVAHPFLSMLRRGVPGHFDGYQASCLTQGMTDLVGEYFVRVVRDEAGVPAVRILLPAHWVFPPEVGREPVFRIQVGSNIPTEYARPEDMEWFKVPDPHNPYGRGVGVVASLDHDVAVYEEAMAALVSTFRNRMRPDLLIAGTFPKNRSDDLEEEFRERMRGSAGAGAAYFLAMPASSDAKLEVHDLNRRAADLQVAQLTQAEKRAILQVTGTPPSVIGDTENANRATAHMAEVSLRKNSTVPALEAEKRHLQARYLEPTPWGPPEYGGEGRMVLAYRLMELVDEDRLGRVIHDMPHVLSINQVLRFVGQQPDPALEGLHAVATKTRIVRKEDLAKGLKGGGGEDEVGAKKKPGAKAKDEGED